MEKTQPVILNLGCGFKHLIGAINVDAYACCKPQVVHDLNKTPYPFEDNSADEILMNHVLEHLPKWVECIHECARILKPGGLLYINVPDESSKTALSYSDHVKVFTPESFHITAQQRNNTNAWFHDQKRPQLTMIEYTRVPYPRFAWMTKWPFKRILRFCADHLRNFIHEQRFVFVKDQICK